MSRIDNIKLHCQCIRTKATSHALTIKGLRWHLAGIMRAIRPDYINYG